MTRNFKTLTQQHTWLLPIIILAVITLIIILLVVTKPQSPKKETTEKAWLVSTETLAFSSASPHISLLGKVESPFDAKLSAAITSEILSVPVRDGQHVVKGQVLVALDAREINLAVSQRQADVNELNAQIVAENNRFNSDKQALNEDQQLLDIATQGVKRQLKLQTSKLGSQERVDQAETLRAQKALSLNARKLTIADHPSRLSQLKARLTRSQTLLRDALIDAERTQIIAPFDGVITGINVAPGERVQVGQTLVTLYDRKNIEVRAQLPYRYISFVNTALAKDALIQAETENYGAISPLQLERLSGQANQGTGGVDALFTPLHSTTLDQPAQETGDQMNTSSLPSALILNSTLKIQVTLPPLQNVATLPLSAIYGSNRIYRIENERLQAIEVTILGKQFSKNGKPDRVIIQSPDIKDGDTIATTQLPTAISGLKVIERAL